MCKCLNCGKEVPQTEGKRARKYCDNKGACKQAYWVKTHPKPEKFVKFPFNEINEDKIYSFINGKLVAIDKKTELAVNASKAIKELKQDIKEVKKIVTTTIPRLPNESSIDYRIRCAELEEKSKTN